MAGILPHPKVIIVSAPVCYNQARMLLLRDQGFFFVRHSVPVCQGTTSLQVVLAVAKQAVTSVRRGDGPQREKKTKKT